ncbi:MAG TPA: phage major capsid protein [Azospirillum sp.]|nr:phage major capsid protein [Azospirillum sp.]
MSLKVLRDRKAKLIQEAKDLGAIDAEKGLTQEQKDRYAAIENELTEVNASIQRAERLAEEERTMVAVTDMTEQAQADLTARVAEAQAALPAAAKDDKPMFASFGDFLQAVAHAENKHTKQSDWDPRVAKLFVPGKGYSAGPSGLNESTPSEGGFTVERPVRTDLLDLMHQAGDIIGRTRRIPITVGNGIKLPVVDETSRADGSRWGGVQAYWTGEADTVTGTKPKFREMDMSLKKLFGLGYATEELLRDSTALGTIMTQAFTEELTFKTEDAIINGTGAGQPLGYLNSGAVITIAAESGQAAQTIVTANILNMWARMPMRSRKSAVWLINQDVEPQLYPLTLGSGTAVTLLYTPPGVNGNNNPYGLLMGRPVIPVEYCATLGTAGDIQLVDLSQYLTIDKDGIQQASSMHVRFIYDEMTFRFIYRVDGQPAWNKPVTPKNGTNTQSPFIVLGTRS